MDDSNKKDILVAKIEQELFNYKQNLIKKYTPEQIIEQAYEINFREQIKYILIDKELNAQEIKMLLKTENILDKLYKKWEHSDGNIWEKLEDNVAQTIEKMSKNYQNNLRKAR